MLAFFIALLGGAGVAGAAAGGKSGSKVSAPEQKAQVFAALPNENKGPVEHNNETLYHSKDAMEHAKGDEDYREEDTEHAEHDMMPVEQKPAPAKPVTEPVERETEHARHDMTPVEEEPAPAEPVMDPVKDAREHAGHDMPAAEDCDHDEGGSTGPCPKTGDPVCHCSSNDEDEDTHSDHAGHEMDHGADPVALPQTQAEIDAFVAAIRSSPEVHSHDMGSSMAGEHMAAMDLVPRAEATHIAIGNGDWDDPANWHNGEVPGDDARVLIPEGVHMTYDHVSDARLFTLRVDGHLDFATDVDSQLVVDTIVISPSGALTIGTATDPVDPNVNVDIIFANNGPIDTDWDPMLLSRGMIAHGTVEIHGAAKDSHEKVIDDPEEGDTWVDLAEAPEGWEVGDTIVIAGTRYEGNHWREGFQPSEDEVRVISDIQEGRIFFDDPLVFDHDTPRADLKTSVANYTRNVSFETEDAATAEVYERGHVMFMHNDDVDVRYAEFHELGRTDKSETALNVGEFSSVDFDTNVKGRYSFHFHRAGMDGDDEPGMAVGNAVYGSPGWGFVHHDSHAILENNATYDTFGAGYVTESGNETGEWHNNIAIFAQGQNWLAPKLGNDGINFDLGQGGDGFWFQSRMVESTDNIAASVNHGFVYFHRGRLGEDGNIKFDSEVSEIEAAFNYKTSITPDQHPILSFDGNEAFAARAGLWVVKAGPNQGHDVHTVMDDFTAWSVQQGAGFEYTSHYIIKDFDIVGKEATALSGAGEGISFLGTVADMTIVDPTIEGFNVGINLNKAFTGGITDATLHDYTVVNPTFTDVTTEYLNYDPALDTIMSTQDLPNLTPDLILDGPLTYKEGPDPDARQVTISGTKADTLGETAFPGGIDDYSLDGTESLLVMQENGYYSTESGQNYFLLDLYFSDRVTGDIYSETHPVLLDENVPMWWGHFSTVEFNGVRELDAEDNLTSDVAELWATLTDGQLILAEDPEVEEDLMLMAAE